MLEETRIELHITNRGLKEASSLHHPTYLNDRVSRVTNRVLSSVYPCLEPDARLDPYSCGTSVGQADAIDSHFGFSIRELTAINTNLNQRIQR